MFDFFDKTINSAKYKARRFVNDPIGETVDTALQPVRDAVEVVSGLTEGELRTKAALRLGADVASGMALGELIAWYEAQ